MLLNSDLVWRPLLHANIIQQFEGSNSILHKLRKAISQLFATYTHNDNGNNNNGVLLFYDSLQCSWHKKNMSILDDKKEH